MHAKIAWVIGGSIVPAIKQLFTLGTSEQRKAIDGVAIASRHRFQQRAEVHNVSFNRRLIEERRGILQLSGNSRFCLLKRQRQIEIRYHVGSRLQQIQFQSWHRWSFAGWVLPDEQDLE